MAVEKKDRSENYNNIVILKSTRERERESEREREREKEREFLKL